MIVWSSSRVRCVRMSGACHCERSERTSAAAQFAQMNKNYLLLLLSLSFMKCGKRIGWSGDEVAKGRRLINKIGQGIKIYRLRHSAPALRVVDDCWIALESMRRKSLSFNNRTDRDDSNDASLLSCTTACSQRWRKPCDERTSRTFLLHRKCPTVARDTKYCLRRVYLSLTLPNLLKTTFLCRTHTLLVVLFFSLIRCSIVARSRNILDALLNKNPIFFSLIRIVRVRVVVGCWRSCAS